ncbi:unnamed protein product [Microthlaspi erraticum]|uniref:DUF1985 domain-containing protein n=1 Tax=Microthlaspi erraticum TaxID=1685480 RepID=A0A6D2LCR7_9BRAS|nr:unnamed protein product [Microthlaspi erraticum]
MAKAVCFVLPTGSDSLNRNWDKQLPRRLFATYRFPTGWLNMYGEASTLTFLHHTLKGTTVFQRIRDSVFGRLFDIPKGRCPYSGKLIHSLLSRQLLTKRKYELWTVFGGQPFRFSLPEFASITGLPAGPWPEGYHPQKVPEHSAELADQAWKAIVGDNPNTTCEEISTSLTNDKGKNLIDPERKFKLALLLIVEGVLIADSLPLRPTPYYVTMLHDVNAFLEFPWARESFFWTLQTMKPGVRIFGESEDPVESYRDKLKGGTYRLTGFPLALQLLAFRLVPNLLRKLREPQEQPTMLAIVGPAIPIKGYISQNSVLLAESDPNLVVTPLLPIEDFDIAAVAQWRDEQVDSRVEYLKNLIGGGHQFQKQEWPGGEEKLPILTPKQPKSRRMPNKSIVRRKQPRRAVAGVNLSQSSIKKPVQHRPKKATMALDASAVQEAIQDNRLLREEVGHLSHKLELLSKKHTKLLQLLRETRRSINICNIRRRSYKRKQGQHKEESLDKGDECCPDNWFASPPRGTAAVEGDDHLVSTNGIEYTLQDVEVNDYSPPLSQYVASKVRDEEQRLSKFTENNREGLFDKTPINMIEPPSLELTNPQFDLTNPRASTPTSVDSEEVQRSPAGVTNVKPVWDNSNIRQEDREVPDEPLVLSDSSPPPPPRKYNPTPAELRLVSHLNLKEPRPYGDLLPPLCEREYELLHEVLLSSPKVEHFTHLRLDFDNQFLLELAKPQHWVSTQTSDNTAVRGWSFLLTTLDQPHSRKRSLILRCEKQNASRMGRKD